MNSTQRGNLMTLSDKLLKMIKLLMQLVGL